MDGSGDATSKSSVDAPPGQILFASSSSPKFRVPSTENKAKLSKDVAYSAGYASASMFSTNEIKETLDKKNKEIFELKVRIMALKRRLEESGEDSTTMDEDDESGLFGSTAHLTGTLDSHSVADQLEKARQQGYEEARRYFQRELSSNSPKPVLRLEEASSPLSPFASPSRLDTTEYRDFPVTGSRVGPLAAVTPLKKALLASASGAASLSASKPAVASPRALASLGALSGGPRMSGLERRTFAMLTTRLTELVEFLEAAVSGGSFNASDTTLNMSQDFISSKLDISLMADAGSGVGCDGSFSLAVKLQEIIDISRELSLHDVGMETDSNWQALQEEKTALSQQVESLQAALLKATAAAEVVEYERISLTERLQNSVVESGRLTERLQDLEKVAQEAGNEIAGLREQLAEGAIVTENLKIKVEEAEKVISDAENARSALNDRVADYETETERLRDELLNMRNRLEEERKANEHLASLLNKELWNVSLQTDDTWQTLSNEKALLLNQIHELNGVLESALGSAEAADAENSSLKDQLAESSAYATRLKTQFEEVQQALHDEKMGLFEEIDALNQAIKEEKASEASGREQILMLTDRLTQTLTETNRLKMEVEEVRKALDSQQQFSQHLESLLNKDHHHVSLQTEISWSTEKSELQVTINRLVDQVEIMESDLIAAKRLTDRQSQAKDEERARLVQLIDRFTDETERLEQANRRLQAEVEALQATLTSTEEKLRLSDEKRARWEKAVHKQIGKTHKVIDQASKNIQGFTRGAAAGPLNPLTENRDPQNRH